MAIIDYTGDSSTAHTLSKLLGCSQGRTDNSWGPPGNRGSWGPCVLAQIQKTYKKGTRSISWGPLLIPGPSSSARVSKWSVRPWM
ncbi:unnamed protein product, partial [Staurois parvus]